MNRPNDYPYEIPFAHFNRAVIFQLDLPPESLIAGAMPKQLSQGLR